MAGSLELLTFCMKRSLEPKDSLGCFTWLMDERMICNRRVWYMFGDFQTPFKYRHASAGSALHVSITLPVYRYTCKFERCLLDICETINSCCTVLVANSIVRQIHDSEKNIYCHVRIIIE